MATLRIWVCLWLGVPLPAGDDVPSILRGVERRYNAVQTIEVQFEQSYSVKGRGRRLEGGTLYLRKPGRMRLDYRQPPGKWFLSDCKSFYFYSPAANRVEKMRLKESDDLRAPLAFLIGRLDFQKDFTKFVSRQVEGGISISAEPRRPDRAPYRQVEFIVAQDNSIQRLIVVGQDASVMEFRFTGERLNARVDDALFRFRLPEGAELVESRGPSAEETEQ